MREFDIADLKAKYKPGTKFRYCDRRLWHIVCYIEDDGDELVLMKTWWNFGWSYKVEEISVFAYTADLCAREFGDRKKTLKRK